MVTLKSLNKLIPINVTGPITELNKANSLVRSESWIHMNVRFTAAIVGIIE